MKRVTLSFDNGPTPGVTDHVLDVLSRYGVKATFFVVGTKLAQPLGRKIVERAHSEGHWIGNHTLNHGPPLGEQTDPNAPTNEIGGLDAMLGPLTHDSRLFRPNGRGRLGPHVLSPQARDFLIAQRATLVLWTHIPRDRIGDAGHWVIDAQRASTECDWPLLVLHDRPSGHAIPAGAMSRLSQYLEWALQFGIEFEQEFPLSCVPIWRGEVRAPLEPYLQVTQP